MVKSKNFHFCITSQQVNGGSIFEVMIKSITLAYSLTDALLVPIISSNEFLKTFKIFEN